MKIIIVGAQGMLGHALADVFSLKQPLLWDRAELDITNRKNVETSIAKVRPDVVLNAAAYTDVDGAETERDLAMNVNATAVGYLADACAAQNICMVHYSTDYVFEGTNASGYVEDAKAQNPINFYGRTKRAGEELFLSPFENKDTPHYLIRTSWLYGPHGKNFPLSMIDRARAGQKEFKVVNDQHGRPTYTYDLSQTTRELLAKKLPPGIYHATNTVEGQHAPSVTWYDIATEIFAQAAMHDASFKDIVTHPCTSDEFPRKAARPPYSILLNTKLPALRPWQRALEEYLSKYVFA